MSSGWNRKILPLDKIHNPPAGGVCESLEIVLSRKRRAATREIRMEFLDLEGRITVLICRLCPFDPREPLQITDIVGIFTGSYTEQKRNIDAFKNTNEREFARQGIVAQWHETSYSPNPTHEQVVKRYDKGK